MLSVAEIIALKDKRKLTMLTAYDYPTAKIVSSVGVDLILVGDSLGMAVLGFKDTRSVTLSDMIRHTAAVVRGNQNSFVIADMPLHTTDTAGMAIRNCRNVLELTGAQAVKVEGHVTIVEALVKAGIAVMGHTGLKPQTAEKYSVQGKTGQEADQILEEALALEKAGAFAVVLECVPFELAAKITRAVKIPTIGIGAGRLCDGQVLVISDMIGLFKDFKPKFLRRYADVGTVIENAVREFKKDVESGSFPSEEESY